MEGTIAFTRRPFDRHVELPAVLPTGYIGEIAAHEPLTIVGVNHYATSVEQDTLRERIDPPIELMPEQGYACAPGGGQIGVYDAGRALVEVYERDVEAGVWRPKMSTPAKELPQDVRDALALLAKKGPALGIIVTHRSDARGERFAVAVQS